LRTWLGNGIPLSVDACKEINISNSAPRR
jgi:hypothetical protein